LMHFSALITSYSHVWAALGVAVALLTWVRALDAPEDLGRWFVCGLGVGFAALMRVQAGIFLLCPAIALGARMWREIAEGKRPVRTAAAGGLVLVGFLAVFAVQLWCYKVVYGAFWVVPQGRSYVLLGHGHPFLTLFAARSGLIYWHPLTWLSVLGL